MTTDATKTTDAGGSQLVRGVRPDPERAAFEAWCDERWGNCSYLHKSGTCGEWIAWQAAVRGQRDCRTCAHYAPHHYGEMLHCSAPLRCVDASSYKLAGGVQLWEARPIEPSPF